MRGSKGLRKVKLEPKVGEKEKEAAMAVLNAFGERNTVAISSNLFGATCDLDASAERAAWRFAEILAQCVGLRYDEILREIGI